ncbi:uncharacterized protein DDB_G0286299-like isoform X3 [Actinia tenebrosa]|uniref:Uncharacterized protein DDB_G0286299-like isoform X1 n=1 Tax=Actinia tenebrosa TaxID=6105 RepID=A0A6P8IBQ8_ACTTE|nr:uncharacterized protein DDB_G0286299-like isoform X1 [Actinia tenebrosa]XP_031562981.1 uncharacterized protein DDB_G0286299-like isoform X2 [Actinia tenebrosa]XP_031562982.1 uncharacterized protein DDB_G0286299-like isoform X3 [Actinia tenebrosa]
MAANEERASLWRTPLSTPVRTNENGIQDLFRHSEKLLASAVSICRLKGSVECQTGGIITVCEEMQRLLRLAFSENARIEKEMKRQKLNYDDEISLLKGRVTFLEEEKELLKTHFKEIKSKIFDDQPRSTSQITKINKGEMQKDRVLVKKIKITGTDSQEPATLKEREQEQSEKEDETLKENVKPDKKEREAVPENIPMETNSEDIDDASLEISYFESPKASKMKAKGRKVASNKVGKKAVSREEKKKNHDDTEVLSNVKKLQDDFIADRDVSNKSRRSSRKSAREDDENVVTILECPDDIGEPLTRSVHLNPETGLLETVEVDEEPVVEVQEKPRKNAKRKDSKKDAKKNRKDAKNIKEGSKGKSKTERENLDNDQKIENGNLDQEEVLGDFPDSESMVSEGNVQKMPDSKTLAQTPEREEELGDVGFLIDISSMITTFVSNPDDTALELPLMSARERADARKLAALFNLHISIGNKMDNRSSLNLSKTSNSKMPKPGKLDSLLSQLSIAAAREAEKASAKTRTKRKFASVADDECNDEQSTWDDSQPKRNPKTFSRSKKARM